MTKISQTFFLNSKVSQTIITKFLLNVDESSPCYLFKAVYEDVCKISALNIFESEVPFSNVGLPNDGHFAQNCPWHRPLRNHKKRSRSIIYNEIPTIW